MKRLVSLLLLPLLLWGCAAQSPRDGVYFVYPKRDYVYSIAQGSVAREYRDVTNQNLSYLVRLYLLGPQEESLMALYPPDVRLESLDLSDGTLSITLSKPGSSLNDITFSLAGACLAQTCFSLCDADTVVISSGDRHITLNRDALVFRDNSADLEPALEAD